MNNGHVYKELAIRIYDILDPWEKDPSKDKTEELTEIVDTIQDSPESIIGHLLDIIEDLQA